MGNLLGHGGELGTLFLLQLLLECEALLSIYPYVVSVSRDMTAPVGLGSGPRFQVSGQR